MDLESENSNNIDSEVMLISPQSWSLDNVPLNTACLQVYLCTSCVEKLLVFKFVTISKVYSKTGGLKKKKKRPKPALSILKVSPPLTPSTSFYCYLFC